MVVTVSGTAYIPVLPIGHLNKIVLSLLNKTPFSVEKSEFEEDTIISFKLGHPEKTPLTSFPPMLFTVAGMLTI